MVAVNLDQDLLDGLSRDVTAAGGKALGIRADALDAAAVEGAVHRAVDAFGRIDVLVNAVGGSTVIAKPAAALDELTLAEWQKLLDFNLTGNAIAPSLTLSERIRPHWERRSAEGQAAEIARTPLGRVASPDDQARVICFLASADADFVTGVTIDVTGGQ